MKKRLLTLLLAATMILSMSTATLAAENADGTTDTDGNQYTTPNYSESVNQPTSFIKTYKINNGKSPAETFNFKFTAVKAVDNNGTAIETTKIPALDNVSASFESLEKTDEKTVNIPIDASKYPTLGVYTYKVEEVIPTTKTTGVTYNGKEMYLVVTILRDESSNTQYVAALHYENATGEKTGDIINQYDAGSLTVGKEITGNMADMSKKFAFTVTFTAPTGTTIKSDITVNNENVEKDGLTYTFKLGDGENVTFSNIPAGTTYTVTEAKENYTASENWSDGNKTISANETDTVTFTNDLTKEVDTGINLDNMPYIVILAVVILAAAVLVIRKRRYTAM